MRLWCLHAAVNGRLPTIPLEIIYASVMVLFTGLAAVEIEQNFDNREFPPGLKLLLVLLFTCATTLFVAFSYRLHGLMCFKSQSGGR